jgi:hypothetical protein
MTAARYTEGMKAHRPGCCQRSTKRRGWAAGGGIFAVLAVLMPKCPLCIAAWLAALGLSGLASRIDPRAIWLAAALAVAALAALVVHRIPIERRRHHEPRDGNT